MADRATRPSSEESSRQKALKGPLYPRLPSLSERPDDEMSSILFDLNELLYARLDKIKEQQAAPLGLDSRWTAENLTDDEDNTPQPSLPPLRSPKGKEKEISVPNFNNPKGRSSTFGRIDKLLRSFNKLRIDKRDTKGIRIAKSALKALAILTMTDEKETEEIGKEIEATSTEEDPGFGNKLLKDLKRGRTTGNYIGNLLPIRPLAKQSTLAYGTLSASDDDGDDFLKLRAADPHLRAKELALFARSFLKELKYSRPDDDFKTQLGIFAD
ncbi:hypothetical protein MBM_08177 [Drepanopeziza brunnea f. sp. 'multigermtubi' MB_m1]|uniref:Uncharacterized protein n=1 Tax=Marssonina brunnea f. sp. multigermtubi (strain MB_m1) TaxID=1072389 RepID=K1XLT9_MARBU|nr:uncharacterized protein MBM_08177 [Drepanopeziza brunnea f. sp. 'multigermtubi' MB_m1]EKD13459.1 hypothetical protein MBM_08177 [Drepanopeziza brunnea f. sp. 'multigermtubi' MB_m1]